ncbi:hypothetical protein HanRHA438_Chr04g0174851 [Helianthus annuus]|nr:hypothetical protein HanRHA438_Chr04g0174851 [Helianthus annuus]
MSRLLFESLCFSGYNPLESKIKKFNTPSCMEIVRFQTFRRKSQSWPNLKDKNGIILSYLCLKSLFLTRYMTCPICNLNKKPIISELETSYYPIISKFNASFILPCYRFHS